MDDDGLQTFSFQLITLLAFPHKQCEVPLHDLNIFQIFLHFNFFSVNIIKSTLTYKNSQPWVIYSALALASRQVTDSNLVSKRESDEEIYHLFKRHWKHTHYHFAYNDTSSHLHRRTVKKTVCLSHNFQTEIQPSRANMAQSLLFSTLRCYRGLLAL